MSPNPGCLIQTTYGEKCQIQMLSVFRFSLTIRPGYLLVTDRVVFECCACMLRLQLNVQLLSLVSSPPVEFSVGFAIRMCHRATEHMTSAVIRKGWQNDELTLLLRREGGEEDDAESEKKSPHRLNGCAVLHSIASSQLVRRSTGFSRRRRRRRSDMTFAHFLFGKIKLFSTIAWHISSIPHQHYFGVFRSSFRRRPFAFARGTKSWLCHCPPLFSIGPVPRCQRREPSPVQHTTLVAPARDVAVHKLANVCVAMPLRNTERPSALKRRRDKANANMEITFITANGFLITALNRIPRGDQKK